MHIVSTATSHVYFSTDIIHSVHQQIGQPSELLLYTLISSLGRVELEVTFGTYF